MLLEKLLDLLKIIIEKFLVPALIAIPFAILSVNLFTDRLDFLDTFTLTENYVFQYMFYFLIILTIYTIIIKLIEKYKENHCWDEWDKEFREDLINEIDSYPEQIRNIIKDLFYRNNNPIEIKTTYDGSIQLHNYFRNKIILTEKDRTRDTIVYYGRFTDSFYKKLIKLNKEKGCISHY